MKIKHYDIITPSIDSPVGNWKRCWYGLYRMGECYSEVAWQQFKEAEMDANRKGYLGERELEVDLFLSILSEIKASSITFIELGAGYADWCMAVNGVIRNKLVETNIKSAICYAVEAEPTHIEWSTKHFRQWDIDGGVIPYVISDINGECDFSIDKDPSSSYGQSVSRADSLIRTVGNMVRRERVAAYSMKLDTLLVVKNIDHVNLIDMDVQGNEVRVIRGAMESIEAGRIDYWKIGTHGRKYNDKLREMLLPYYDIVADIYPNSIGRVDGLVASVQDGIQVYKRKGLGC